jgi:hypothetical protein
MAKPSLVVALVEDGRHQNLIRAYLKRDGLDGHSVRFLKSPHARGSGEQWVREHFPLEVNAYRLRQARAETRLIVVIDADNRTVQKRFSQLDDALKSEKIAPVNLKTERIVRLVPRRNVETWLLFLSERNNTRVDEMNDYKPTRNDWDNLIKPSAEKLYRWTRPNAQIPNACIPSLKVGIVELRRLSL